MKRILFFIWISLLSAVARSAEWGVSGSQLTGGEGPNSFVGDGTGTCAAANAFVGDGTGTCAAPNAFVGDGTGTCAALNFFEIPANSPIWRNPLHIQNLMRNARTEAERKLLLEKLQLFIESEIQ